MATNNKYSDYAKSQGFHPLRGKSREFNEIAEEFFFIESRIRFLCLFDPDGELEAAKAERSKIAEKLLKVCKPPIF